MKKVILLLSLCVVTWSFVGASVKKEALRPITKPGTSTSVQKPDVMAEKIKAALERSEQRVQERSRTLSRDVNAELIGILDSVVYRFPDESNYTKQTYEYDEDYYDTSEKLYAWSGKDWAIVKVLNYEWEKRSGAVFVTAFEELDYFYDDDDKPILDDNGNHFYMGVRQEFTYNSKGFQDSAIKIAIENGDQIPETKNTYVYDARGNAIELYQYLHTGEDWQVELKALVEYDTKNREKVVENYEWINNKWVGTEKGIYEYDPVSGNVASFEYPSWDTSLEVWVNYHKQLQKFVNGKLTEQGDYFWNIEANDWIGGIYWGEWAHCIKSILVYNAEGLQTAETSYVLEQDGVTWTPTVDMVITYDPVPDEPGYFMYERKTYFNVEGDMEHWQTLRYKYYIATVPHEPAMEHKPLPANSVVVYAYEYNSKTFAGFEDYYKYDDALNLIETKEYKYKEELDEDEKGKGVTIRLSDIWGFMKYDTNRNIIELISMQGDGTEEGWVYFTKYEYEFGRNNIRTREFAYRYAGEDVWTKDYGTGLDMDYNVLVNQLVVNLGYENPYKKTYEYNFANDGANNWVAFVRTFYYGSIGDVSVDSNKDNSMFSVYPNPVVDMVTINCADESMQVNLYNLQGAKLLQTNEKQINMAGFTSGVYILEVNGAKAKIVKK